MRPWQRVLGPRLVRAARAFGAVIVTGPRRAAKTHLLRTTFPKAAYALLESPEVLARIRGDPRGWLESLRPPVILDEVQNAPELFLWIRSGIDADPRKKGRWLSSSTAPEGLGHTVPPSLPRRSEPRPLSSSWKHDAGTAASAARHRCGPMPRRMVGT